MKIVAISDVHGNWQSLTIPACDLLISLGDYSSANGTEFELIDYHKWLNVQPAKHVVSVQGNHEVWIYANFKFAQKLIRRLTPRIHFLDEGLLELGGFKIFCSAATAWREGWSQWAWGFKRGDEMRSHWDVIPLDIDILATHAAPYGILDRSNPNGPPLGCPYLRARLFQIKPLQLHVFGHIHNGSGECEENGIYFVNGSVCDDSNQPVYPVRSHALDRPRPRPLDSGIVP